MKNNQARNGGEGAFPPGIGTLLAAASLCLAAQAGAGMPEPPKRGPGATGASGSVLGFEEAPGARIVYLEEKGGILLPVGEPVPGSRRGELPPPDPDGRAGVPAARATARPPDASAGKPAWPAPPGPR